MEAGSVSEQTSVTESKQSTPTEPVKCPVLPRNDAQVGDNHMERGMKVNKCSNGSLFDSDFRRLSFFFCKQGSQLLCVFLRLFLYSGIIENYKLEIHNEKQF